MLLESLCTELKATDIASAEMEKNKMEAKVDEMGYACSQLYLHFFLI